jgi:predicted enzyme related to lactoylglutathione lyase
MPLPKIERWVTPQVGSQEEAMSTATEQPMYRTGKICYIEIPATNVHQSAEFYSRAFSWKIRQRGDGSTAFDDTVNEVSGTWVLGRPVGAQPGLIVYIMVASAADAVNAVVSAGGEIVEPVDPQAREVVATFRDPAGNVMGIYQQPGLAETEPH